MKKYNFISCRRFFLDHLLHKHIKTLSGLVLDIGGKKENKRGAFRLPNGSYEIYYVNLDLDSSPDLVAALPLLPIKNGVASYVICTEVLEYVDNLKDSIDVLSKLLKPSGVLYLSTPFLHRLHDDKCWDFNRYTSSHLDHTLRQYFSDVEIIPMGGLKSVIFDLMYYKTKSRLLKKILRFYGLFLARRDNTDDDVITTGFFCIARK